MYAIGTKFMSRGKCPRECTVIDIHTTYNDADKVIKIRYVATHDFVGQIVTDYDVLHTTIKRSISNWQGRSNTT